MKKTAFFILLFSLALAMSSALSAPVYLDTEPPISMDDDTFEIICLNLGRSNDAFLLRNKGMTMLIDGGQQAAKGVLLAQLEAEEVQHFDYILNTHPHDDHTDGIYAVLQGEYTVDHLFVAYHDTYRNPWHLRLIEMAQTQAIPHSLLSDGDVFMFGDVRVEVMRGPTTAGVNGHSIATRFVYKEATALFMADVSGIGQQDILDRYESQLDADILKVGHHGLNRQVPGFLSIVSPELAIITSRKSNQTIVVPQLEKAEIPIYYITRGNIHLVSDGEAWYARQEGAK